jgi:predicted nucleotidyltransferase
MSLQLTAEQLSVYRRTAQVRWQRQQRESTRRRRQAWRFARRAAALLKQEYGATRVVVFGSLAHGAWFHAGSDLDLAVEGLKPGVIWRAWSAVERVAPGFQVDLIELETATDRLHQRIQEQGKEL